MTLGQYMGWRGETTYREHLSWEEWLFLKSNRPSTTEQYLMSIRAEIRQSNSKKGHKVKIEDMKLDFVRKVEKEADKPSPPGKSAGGKPLTRDQAANISKAKWAARVGGKLQHEVISREEAERRGFYVPPDKS